MITGAATTTSNLRTSNMARVAIAVFALLVQGALAAPSYTCSCAPTGYVSPGYGYGYGDASFSSGPIDISPDYSYGPYAAAPAVYDASSLAPAQPLDAAAFAFSAPEAVSSSSPLTPSGPPVVVGTSAGAPKSYTQGPFCKTSTFEVPVKSSTSAVSGPPTQITSINEGYCSTACAATRAKCGGTTKKVSFKTPTIINKGSRTCSAIFPAGKPVTTQSTKAGAPQVATEVRPGPSYGPVPVPAPAPSCSYPTPLYSGPAVSYDAPGYSYGPYGYDAPGYSYGSYGYDAPAYSYGPGPNCDCKCY